MVENCRLDATANRAWRILLCWFCTSDIEP